MSRTCVLDPYGVPPARVVEQTHHLDILVIGTATTVLEAVALDDAGVDVIVATGTEAGGHRVSFLAPAEDSLIGTFALVPQVVDAVSVPVIAAGGIADGRGLPGRLSAELRPEDIGTFPLQSWLTGLIRRSVNDRGLTDFMALWASQAAPLICYDDATAFIDALATAGDEHSCEHAQRSSHQHRLPALP